MKKSHIIIGAIGMFFANNAQAQVEMVELGLHRVELGVQFMTTISNFDMRTFDGATVAGEGTLGWGLGASMGFNFTKHLGIRTEVVYNSLSQKYTSNDIDKRLDVQYLNVPLFFTLSTGKTKPVSINLLAGPQAGFSLGSDVSASTGSGSDTLSAVVDLKEGDFGLAYGACVSFSLNSMRTIRLDFGYRGVWGISNVSDNSQSPEEDTYYAFGYAAIRTNSIYTGLTLCF